MKKKWFEDKTAQHSVPAMDTMRTKRICTVY